MAENSNTQAGELSEKHKQERQDEFESIVRPVIKWLAENQHPHTSLIITSTHAELVEGVRAISTSEYLPD